MALTILIRGQLNSLSVLDSTAFTKTNFGVHPNTTLSANTPRGVLGGSVAAVSDGDDYTAIPGTADIAPLGLFVNDAAGAAFENAPAVASGKIAVMKGQGSVEIDVFETRNAADNADLVYAVGEDLFSSAQGFLTNETSADGTVIGIVTKVPITASPTLGLDMRI